METGGTGHGALDSVEGRGCGAEVGGAGRGAPDPGGGAASEREARGEQRGAAAAWRRERNEERRARV